MIPKIERKKRQQLRIYPKTAGRSGVKSRDQDISPKTRKNKKKKKRKKNGVANVDRKQTRSRDQKQVC